MAKRPKKIFRLNFFSNEGAAIALFGGPNEIRLLVSPDKFLSVTENGVTLSPGMGSSVNIQGMSHNLKYGGMISDLPFPLSMMPVTPATPLPKQVFVPPLMKLLPIIRDFSTIASAFVGV